jgi:hypothetical protein
MVIEIHAVACEAPCSRKQGAGAVGFGARHAQGRAAFRARQAMAAGGHEHHHHMIVGRQTGHVAAAFHDRARCLVAEHHRQWARPVAVDHRKIGVAEACRGDAHQHLAGSGRRQFDVADF